MLVGQRWVRERVCENWVVLEIGDKGVECGDHPGQQQKFWLVGCRWSKIGKRVPR